MIHCSRAIDRHRAAAAPAGLRRRNHPISHGQGVASERNVVRVAVADAQIGMD
jgi:hypothetical protein